MKEDDFEIDAGSRDRLQGILEKDPVLKEEVKLAARERPGTSETEQVDGRSRHERPVVTTMKEAAIFNSGHAGGNCLR